ncbi:cyclic nucleotide-binding domain-containing protein [Actinomadura madurae]|uniref:Crp/Fnr family transcriptional regulator n=1 Tax=Actinomadura madurae TaxID=1993 RepID=UPI002025FD64|nr:cyclic nucleotide-binding domain-containing protein [Actinomadura madurae]URM96919.1 cyclic nucleotide-binding domain-containing protein [Actinomadura madurae]
MNDHARDHDPDQIVNSELMPRPRTARPAETARRQGFWPSLTTIEQAAFLASAREVVYPVGAVLWAEGQSADQTIVIKSGSVRVSVERDGRERIIAFRGPGDILGERAALMLRRRSATVVAMDTLHALLLSTQEFVAYLSDHPRVVAVLEHEMYDRMTEQHGSAQPPHYATGPMHPYGPAAQYGPPQPYASAYMPVLPHYQYAMTGPFTVAGAYAVPDPRTGGAAYLTNAPMTNAPMTNAPLPAHTIGAVVEASYEQPTQPMDIPRRKGASWAGQNCTIVYTDVAGFSSPGRDDADRIDVRRAMYRALQEAFEDSGVPWDGCHIEDRGDGALIVVPPQVTTAAVIDPMLVSLGMRLRRHNHRSSEAVRIQLRVAVNVGPVMPDPPGVSGSSIITTARLLDAPPLKQRLAATGADLGVIASRFVYDSVIVHSPGYVKATEYEQVSCRVKDSDVEGWIHLHGLPAESAL